MDLLQMIRFDGLNHLKGESKGLVNPYKTIIVVHRP